MSDSGPSTALFLDTNIFLQCLPLDELPWDEVDDCPEKVLLISRPVQEELDRQKQDGNHRRAKRARKSAALLRQLLFADNEEKPLSKDVEWPRIALAPSLHPLNPEDILDLSKSDDRIVGEALAYQKQHPEATVILVSHDTNILLTAKRTQVAFFAVPDTWLLPPESDTRDKRIKKLEQQLAERAKTEPDLKVSASPAGGEVVVSRYREFTSEEISSFRQKVADAFPMKEDFDRRRSWDGLAAYSLERYRPPSDHEIEKYQETDYPNWLSKVEDFFRFLPAELAFPTRWFILDFALENHGVCPARNLIVEISALGGLLLVPPEKIKEGPPANRPSLPSPPTAPQGKIEPLIPDLSSQDHVLHNHHYYSHLGNAREERDRYTFYWRKPMPADYVDKWELECEEFRHRSPPKEFHVSLFVPLDFEESRGAVKFRVTAGNMSEPIETTASVTVSYEDCVADDEVSDILQKLNA